MKLNLNLASRRYVNKFALQRGFWVLLCLLLVFIGWQVNTLLIDNQTLQQNQQRVQELKRQLQTLQGAPRKPLTEEKRKDLEKKYKRVKDLLDLDAFRWTALLDRMETLLPDGVSLHGFKPDYAKKSLAITGYARDLGKMRLFLDRLLKNEKFAQVYLKRHQRITVKDYAAKDREVISFSIQIEGVF